MSNEKCVFNLANMIMEDKRDLLETIKDVLLQYDKDKNNKILQEEFINAVNNNYCDYEKYFALRTADLNELNCAGVLHIWNQIGKAMTMLLVEVIGVCNVDALSWKNCLNAICDSEVNDIDLITKRILEYNDVIFNDVSNSNIYKDYMNNIWYNYKYPGLSSVYNFRKKRGSFDYWCFDKYGEVGSFKPNLKDWYCEVLGAICKGDDRISIDLFNEYLGYLGREFDLNNLPYDNAVKMRGVNSSILEHCNKYNKVLIKLPLAILKNRDSKEYLDRFIKLSNQRNEITKKAFVTGMPDVLNFNGKLVTMKNFS